MEPNLREQFDRAVSDDPGADPGDIAFAAILGVSASVVKMRTARALGRLRALLGEDFLTG